MTEFTQADVDFADQSSFREATDTPVFATLREKIAFEKAQRHSRTISPARPMATSGNRKYCSANTDTIVSRNKRSRGLGNLPCPQGVFTITSRHTLQCGR